MASSVLEPNLVHIRDLSVHRGIGKLQVDQAGHFSEKHHTGPIFATVFLQMGKVADSHFRAPVRTGTAQRRVWELFAHLV